jgi:hypothetical protein
MYYGGEIMPASNTENTTRNTTSTSTNPNNTVINTGIDQLDLELIEREINGCLIAIIANLVLIESSIKNRQIILDREMGIEPSAPLEATQLAALSSSLTLLSNAILENIAYTRLIEREQTIEAGTAQGTIIPNINITTGFRITLLGNSIKLIGAIQRLQEQGEITIL